MQQNYLRPGTRFQVINLLSEDLNLFGSGILGTGSSGQCAERYDVTKPATEHGSPPSHVC
jgi:hypothetical protein